MRRFHEVLRAILVTSLAGCGGSTVTQPDRVDATGLHLLPCTPDDPLPGVQPATPVAYAELRATSGRAPVAKRGSLCEGALDAARCRSDYEAIAFVDSDRAIFGEGGGQAPIDQILITSDQNGIKVYRSREEVLAWILPIDTEGDAVAVAQLKGYGVTCNDLERGAVGAVSGGYRVIAMKRTSDCNPIELRQYLLELDGAGQMKELDSRVIYSSSACIGRRPEGLIAATPSPPTSASAIGRWLAEVAYLEAASVRSFERLAAELARFGAPAALIGRAERARADEVRHAEAMGRLARRHGSEVPAQRPLDFAERSLEAFAEENAVEGCVLETFGALIGLHQAEKAEDLELRRTMKRIAKDESRHGELAWDVHAWATSRLDAAARARIEIAQTRALESLSEGAVDPAEAVDGLDDVDRRVLGLPAPALRRAMARTFHLQVPKMWPSTRAWKMKYGGRQAPTPGGASGTAEQT
ncbi:MAG: ferritin-like domain-containing protein [Labilithrix sp.]